MQEYSVNNVPQNNIQSPLLTAWRGLPQQQQLLVLMSVFALAVLFFLAGSYLGNSEGRAKAAREERELERLDRSSALAQAAAAARQKRQQRQEDAQ